MQVREAHKDATRETRDAQLHHVVASPGFTAHVWPRHLARDAPHERVLIHGIFLMLFLLLIGMVSGYVLEMFHINWIAEAGGVLLVGLLAGWLIKEEEETAS